MFGLLVRSELQWIFQRCRSLKNHGEGWKSLLRFRELAREIAKSYEMNHKDTKASLLAFSRSFLGERSPLLASPRGGVAERSRKYRAASAFSRTGGVPIDGTRNTTQAASIRGGRDIKEMPRNRLSGAD